MSNVHMSIKFGIYSIRDLQAHYERKTSGHWFEPSTMRFFRSRLNEKLYYCERLTEPSVILFISSEQGPNGIRRYTIRSYAPETGEIDTVGDFQQYKTLNAAKRAAEKLGVK